VALGDHIQLALRSPGRKLAPQGLVHNLKKIGRIFRVGRQEDAHEFMRYLVEAMQLGCVGAKKLPPGVADTSVVHSLFGGLLCSSLQCDCCQGRPSLTYDPFMDLSLEIVRAGSVEQALARFCEAERLDGDNKYKCERTNRKVAATKRFAIHRAPNVLTLQLKRFESYGARGGKIDRPVKFSPTLDLAPFMSQPSRDKGQHMYSLTGVLVHQGRSTHSGHYYAFVRSPGGGWHRMDDEQVAPVSEAKVCEQQAYMLFYTKVGQGAATAGAPAKAPSAPVGNRLANGQEPPLGRSKAPLSVRTKGEYDLAPAGPEAPSLPPSPTRPPTPRRVGRVRDARIAGMRHLVARTLAKTKAAQRKKKGVQKRSAAKEKPALPPLPVADAAPQHATAAVQSGVWFQRTRADGEAAPAQDLPVARKRVKAAAAVVAEPPRPAHAPASEADDAALRAALSYPRRYNAYGVDGIARWEDVAHTPAAAAADALVRQQRPAFAAKRKDRELYDEEYDKGKVKKVKMRALGGMPEGDNPFDARPAPARQAGGAKRGAGQARRMAGKDKRRGKAR
jgi:ubiquitin carboxyl-terminal hydrolase 36/42